MQPYDRCALISCLLAAATVSAGQAGLDQANTVAPPEAAKPDVATESTWTVPEAIDKARDAMDRLMNTEDPKALDEAAASLDRAFAIVKTQAPDHPWLPYISAGVFRHKGQNFDAVSELERFVNTREGGNEWKAHRMLGDLVIDGDFPRLARSHYRDAAALKQGESSVLFGLSRCAAAVGDYSEAFDYAKQAVAADRRATVRLLNHLAQMGRINQDWPVATAAASDALTLARRHVDDHAGEFEPLELLEAQYQLVIDTNVARLTDLRSPNDLERGYLQLVEYTRQRGNVITSMTKHSVVKTLEQALDRLGDDTPVVLLEQTVIAMTEAQREDDAADVCRRILAKDPTNALATQWLNQHGTPDAVPNGNGDPIRPDSD